MSLLGALVTGPACRVHLFAPLTTISCGHDRKLAADLRALLLLESRIVSGACPKGRGSQKLPREEAPQGTGLWACRCPGAHRGLPPSLSGTSATPLPGAVPRPCQEGGQAGFRGAAPSLLWPLLSALGQASLTQCQALGWVELAPYQKLQLRLEGRPSGVSLGAQSLPVVGTHGPWSGGGPVPISVGGCGRPDGRQVRVGGGTTSLQQGDQLGPEPTESGQWLLWQKSRNPCGF